MKTTYNGKNRTLYSRFPRIHIILSIISLYPEVSSITENPGRPPLSRLVLFMVCLSVAGAFLAGAHYYAVDLPHQKNLQVPANSLTTCSQCETTYHACMDSCRWGNNMAEINTCRKNCKEDYNRCDEDCG